MARKRASMREGPLAELFARPRQPSVQPSEPRPSQAPPPEKAAAAGEQTELIEPDRRARPRSRRPSSTSTTSAARRHRGAPRADSRAGARAAPVTPVAAVPEPMAEPEPAPSRSRPSSSGAAEPPYQPPASRLLQPMPGSAPRLEVVRRGDLSSYLAVIRVAGVGGAGLNAVTG